MQYFNGVFFLSLLFFLVLFIFLFVKRLKKVRHGWLYTILLFMIFFLIFYIVNCFQNKVFENFESDICEKYEVINRVEFEKVNYGEISRIVVYFNINVSDEESETIFIDIMKHINKPELGEYLKKGNYDLLIIQVFFLGAENQRYYSEQYKRSDWFTEENYKIQKWKNRSREYYYFEYMD